MFFKKLSVVPFRERFIFSLSLTVIIVVMIAAVLTTRKFQELSGWVEHTFVVINSIKDTHASVRTMIAGERGYVITGLDSFAEPYHTGKKEFFSNLDKLKKNVADNPRQLEKLAQLEPLVNDLANHLESVIEIRKSQGLEKASHKVLVGGTKELNDKINLVIADFVESENVLLKNRLEAANHYAMYSTIMIILGGVSAIIFALIAISFLYSNIETRAQSEDQVKKLNETLRRKFIELTTTSKELETFCYSVSHDLRAPLRGIAGFSEAIIEDHGDKTHPEVLGYLKRIIGASKKMGELIDGLLSLSRLNRKEINFETVNITKLAQNAADELRAYHPQVKSNFSIENGMNTYGDSLLLGVALTNLIENAWKFSSKKPSIEITVGVEQINGRKTFFVRDQGAGFDMKYVDKLFGVFQRLHSTTDFEGTGIGLATVQRIIRRHGGEIWAQSKVGEGTTFYFTLSEEGTK